MPFNTTKLRENLAHANPASPAYFEVRFVKMPNIFLSIDGKEPVVNKYVRNRGGRVQKWEDNFQDFKMRCSETDLPARQLMTQERRYAGPQRLIPYGVVYSTLNVNLIEGKNLRMREIFDTWQDAIFGTSGTRDHQVYRPQYYDDVIADLMIDIYDKSGNVVRSYLLTDAFPVSVNPSQLSWSGMDQVMTIPVEFAFHEFIGKSEWNNSKQKGSKFNPNRT